MAGLPKLEHLVRETNYQDVLNLATIYEKTEASGPDTSLVAFEAEEQDLMLAAQEDEDGQVVVLNPQTRSPPIQAMETNCPSEEPVPLRTPSPDSTLMCQILIKRKRKTIACGERLPSYEALVIHEEEIHHMKKVLVCQPCRQRFKSVKDRQSHSLVCPFNQKCPFCHLRYGTLKALRVHMEARHREATRNLSGSEYKRIHGDRVCPHCQKMLARPALLKQHLERGKCIPKRETSPSAQVPTTSLPTSEFPGRSLRQTRGLNQALDFLGLPPQPQDGEGSKVNLPQEPLGPENYDIVYPNAQTKEQVAAGCRGGENITITIPLDCLTDEEVTEGGFCLAYRCGLCHFVVVSDIGALMYHQQVCKRIDLRPINKTQFMETNRCFLCGLTSPAYGEFFDHYDKCRSQKFDPNNFTWHGPPPPKAARVSRPF